MILAHFCTDRRHRRLNKVCRRPIALGSANAEDEILQDLRTERRVVHFRMKLHGPDATLLIRNAGKRVRSNRRPHKSRWKLQRLIAVAHPHLQLWRKPRKEWSRGILHRHFGIAILTLRSWPDHSAQMMHNVVQPVADTKNRRRLIQNSGVGCRSVHVINRRRPA